MLQFSRGARDVTILRVSPEESLAIVTCNVRIFSGVWQCYNFSGRVRRICSNSKIHVTIFAGMVPWGKSIWESRMGRAVWGEPHGEGLFRADI